MESFVRNVLLDHRIQELRDHLESRSHSLLKFELKVLEGNRSCFITCRRKKDDTVLCKGGPFYHHSSAYAWTDATARSYSFGRLDAIRERDEGQVPTVSIAITKTHTLYHAFEAARLQFDGQEELIRIEIESNPALKLSVLVAAILERYKNRGKVSFTFEDKESIKEGR